MNTLKHIFSLACVLSGLVFFGCESDEQNPYKDKNNNEQITHQPLGDLDVHPMGETIIMSYTSAVDWVLETDSSDDWRTVSPKRGKAGTTELTITVKSYLNDGQIGKVADRSRKSSLVFKSGISSEEIDTCKITQELAYIIVEGDVNNSFDFDYCDVAAKEVTIKSNIDFQIDIEGFDFTLKEDDNDVNGSIINPNGAPHTMMLSTNERYYITDSNNGFDKREARLRVSPLSRSYNTTAGSLEYKTVDGLDALEYTITQDYRVMFLTAEVPTIEKWSTIPCITKTNELSPFGANYLVADSNGENDGEATTTFYCIYDLRGEGRVAPELTTESSDDDISLEVDGASFEIETEDELKIWCQKYKATVNTPNTDLMGNREIECSVMDTHDTVQNLSVVQGHFDFSLQYENDGQMTDVDGTILPYSYEAGDAKRFNVKTSEKDLMWSMAMDNNAFDCVGIDSGENFGGKTFTISTAAMNYSISNTQSANVEISPMLGDIELQTISFTLEQEAFLFKFDNNNDDSIVESFAVDATTGNVGFRSYGGLNLTVEQEPLWLKAEAEAVNGGNNSYKIKLTFTEPDGLRDNKNKSVTIEDRSTTVSIVSATHAEATDKPQGMIESDYTKTIIVNQDGYKFTVDTDKIDKVAADGGEYRIGVECTNTYSVGRGSYDWITVTKSNDNKEAIITVSKNETDKERKGTVTIEDGKFENSYEISVTQEAGEKPEEEPEVNPDDDNTEEEVTE